MTPHQPIVDDLIALLEARPDLESAVEDSIRVAALPGVGSLLEYFEFVNEMVVLIPTDRSLQPAILKFYFLIAQSPTGILQRDEAFQRWMVSFAMDWGRFLDTPESAKAIPSFESNPSYHIADYQVTPSGWLTFNHFFARQVRPGKRPLAGLCDDRVVLSPADSVFMGHWPIDEHSTIRVKGLKWSVLDLLKRSPFQDRFRGGIFTHSFLNVNDYHRFHVPVGGRILEARKIPGSVRMDVIRKPDGTFEVVDGAGFQFAQDRGLIVIDSPLGVVAVLPIGMAQVSSVTLTAEEGADLFKGEEFGFFAFGGSDIVMLFEAGRVEFDAQIGTHYNQGRRIGGGLSLPGDGRFRTP